MEYKRIFKDGIHLFSGQVGNVIFSLVILIILTRVLTTEQMGMYSLFFMVVSLALVVGLNWTETSIVRHGREEYVISGKVNQSFWARMYIFVPVIIVFTLLFVIFSKQITSYIGIDQRLIILLIVVFLLNGLLNFINRLYQSTDRMKRSAYILLSQKVFYLICLALIYFNVFRTSLTAILILINVSFLLAIIVNIVTFDFGKIMPRVLNKEYLKRIWIYSWPQLIGFPGIYIVNYIDLFVIKRFMTLSDVGVYDIAYAGFTNIAAFIMLMSTVFFPLIVEYRAKKKFGMIKKHVKNTPVFVLAWIVLVVIGLIVSKYIFPLLFSSKYVASVPAFNVLLIASIFYFVSIYLLPIVNAFDLIIYSQIFNLVKAGINIAGDFILVPKMGIIGAAYATMISYFVAMLLSIMLLIIKRKKIFGVSK
jgi:O-antigen/teichoic acid export membrane protein